MLHTYTITVTISITQYFTAIILDINRDDGGGGGGGGGNTIFPVPQCLLLKFLYEFKC